MSAIDARAINIDQLKLEHFAKGDKFECDAVRIGALLGAKELGHSYDIVLPESARVLSTVIAGRRRCSLS